MIHYDSNSEAGKADRASIAEDNRILEELAAHSAATAYADVTVVVDGAVEETETFYDQTLLDHFIHELGDEAVGHGYPTEVFVQYHEHADDIECECAQYETSHKPYAAWNVDQ